MQSHPVLSGGELQSPAQPEPRVPGSPLIAQAQRRLLLSSSSMDQSMEMSSKTEHIVGICLEMQFKQTKGIHPGKLPEEKTPTWCKAAFFFYFGPPWAEQSWEVRAGGHCPMLASPPRPHPAGELPCLISRACRGGVSK